MKNILHILLVIIAFNLKAQQKIEIINADTTFGDTKNHPDYWRLIGNVKFKHHNTIMNCDSAYHYINKDQMKAFGNIKINQLDSIIITGNHLTYFGKKKKAEIKENVILQDKYMMLKTEKIIYKLDYNTAFFPYKAEIIDNEKTINSGEGEYQANTYQYIFKDSVTVHTKEYNILTNNMHYNSKNGITSFFGPSYIISEDKTIYCENGWYNTKMDKAQFKENAKIKTKKYVLYGDSLYYNKNTGYGKAIKNVKVISKTEDMEISGDLGEYFEKENLFEIKEEPILEILLEEDTLSISAEKFISYQQLESRILIAKNNVKFFTKDLQGGCDSLSYNSTDSTIEMFTNPILWLNKSQITADSMKFIIHNGKLKKLHLNKNPFITIQEDSLDYNQIKGKKMTAFFSKNKIKKIDVQGNGQSLFIVNDEENNEKVAINYIESSNLILYLKNNKINKIKYEINPYSITTPYKDIQERDRYLKGFNCRKKKQPKNRKDIAY